jgi:lipopolysaccharide biosynthesis glycosyltransferase
VVRSTSSIPRVVIGAGPNDRLPAKVCEWSIRAHLKPGSSVQIIHTFERTLPMWSGGTWTAFSFVRWWIPTLLRRRGRAIYLDSDMLVFADIRSLWDVPMNGKAVLRHREPSVLVIDCRKAARFWDMKRIVCDLESGRITYAELMMTMNRMPVEMVGNVPEDWNHLDRYRKGRTKLLHYTKVRTQPWRWGRHRFGALWYEALERALRAGMVPQEWLDDLPAAIADSRMSAWRKPAR